jgi:hypothetical protein
VPRPLLFALVLTACSGNASSDKELGDIRAELADQRAEMRAMRQEIRELRDEIPKTAGDEPKTEPEVEPPAAPPPPAGFDCTSMLTEPWAGAAVFVAEKKVGVTPVIIKTPVGSSEISVRLEKSGYRPRLMTLRPEEDTKISVQLARKSE